MPREKADLILHPIRMRILQTVAGQQMTARQVVAALQDVPQATLYRHLNKLVEGGVLVVVAENQVRGNLERVFALPPQAATLTADDLANTSKEEHLRYFLTFVASLVADLGQTLETTEDIADLFPALRYNKGTLFLTTEEVQAVQAGMRALLAPFLAHQPTPDRQRYVFSITLFPTTHEPHAPADE